MSQTDPLQLFRQVYDQAVAAEIPEPNAMNLATVSASGTPSSRMLLLKGFDENGFVFYTNLGSRKVADMRANPHVALCFYWQPLYRQVRIEGTVAQVDDALADEYFATRPRLSQIGAWASRQSQELDDRSTFEARVAEIEARFEGQNVPRPDFWSGFLVTPLRFEFWNGREFRMHERHVYERDADGTWRSWMLYP
jgi:pyridoxamine 5'-phosphate oxidase